MKVYISPHPSGYAEDGRGSGGIWRVINAQAKHLPEMGIEMAAVVEEADLFNIHAGAMFEDTALSNKPMVASNHGYYWTGDFHWQPEYWQYNAAVIEVTRRAHAVITPSEWVAQPIARDMRIEPHVIPHGVDIEHFEPQPHEHYVLWAKPRVDVVSDPQPMNKLAALAKEVQFHSTFGRPSHNVNILGAMPYHVFRDIMAKAMVWLATTRETGDIASREAMALAIPVLGWDWGATGELVRHKETGYLAAHEDYEDLLEGLRYCIEHRERLGAAAREDIRQRFQWRDSMKKYAAVFRQALEDDVYSCKVSVVVPSYNYAHFLPEALGSLVEQTLEDFEVIVVDDGSTDNTSEVVGAFSDQLNLTYVHKENGGLCSALNVGHELAQGEYIINFDPDNLLPKDALRDLSMALDEKPWIDVAGGGLAMYSPDGEHKPTSDWPFGRVNSDQQLNHYNQLHSSSMMRARSTGRLGGYRMRQFKNEDGEFWCRAISAGLRLEQVTEKPTLVYRWHDGNKSKTEGGEDHPDGPLSWNFYYPWSTHKSIIPFGATVDPPKSSWAVRSYHSPHISVVIPCGPGHERYLVDALDSVYGQTFRGFECVVANDTGGPLDVAAMGHPWVRVIDAPRKGPAVARNLAIEHARAPLIVPLDADDLLYPEALENFYSVWLEIPENLVYADCFTEDMPGRRKEYHCGPWSWARIKRRAIYQVTILYAKQWWEEVRGYDADMVWEDWLFGVKLHLAGVGATYLQKPWGVYRHWTGDRNDENFQIVWASGKDDDSYLQELYRWIERKEQEMACPGCRKPRGQNAPTIAQKMPEGEDRLVVYDGQRGASFHVNSRFFPGKKYYVEKGVPFMVAGADVGWLSRVQDYHVVHEVGLEQGIPPSPPEAPPVAVDWQTPDGSLDKLLQFGWANEELLERFRQGGLPTMRSVTEDLRNGGEKVLAVKGIGQKRMELLRGILVG